jgi:hypothetical protein
MVGKIWGGSGQGWCEAARGTPIDARHAPPVAAFVGPASTMLLVLGLCVGIQEQVRVRADQLTFVLARAEKIMVEAECVTVKQREKYGCPTSLILERAVSHRCISVNERLNNGS